jgi:predicted MFS family arabinose efflux permease
MGKPPVPSLHPAIHKLVISQALSKLGDNFTEVALALFVLALTHRNVADLGVVLAMTYAPGIILGWVVAGVIERLDRRRTIFVADVARGLLVASIPFVHNYVWTLGAVFVMYSFSAVYRPLVRAVQPQIAGDAETNAKSGARQQSYYAVADIGAYLAAAGVLFLWGVAPAFWIDAATYFGAAFLIVGIRVTPDVWAPAAARGVRFWAQLAGGYRYLREQALILQLTAIAAVVSMATAALNTFTAPLSHRLWHVSSDHYVWLLLAIACGTLLSGTVVERYGLISRWSLRYPLACGFLLVGGGYALVLGAGTWWEGAMCLVLVGVGNGLFGTALMFWVQQATPAEVRARVLAIRATGLGMGGALGAWLGGWLAQTRGLPAAIAVVSAIWLVLVIWLLAARTLAATRVEDNVA